MPKFNNRSRQPIQDDDVDDDDIQTGGPADDVDEDDDDDEDDAPSAPVTKSVRSVSATVGGESAIVADMDDVIALVAKSVRVVVRQEIARAQDEGVERAVRVAVRKSVGELIEPVHELLKGMDSRHEEINTFMENLEAWSDTVDETNAAITKSLTDLGDVSVLSKSIATLNETANATIEAAKTTPETTATGAAPVTSGTESAVQKGVISGSAAEAAALPATDAQRQEIGKLVQEAESLQESLHKSVPGYGPMVDLLSGGHPISGEDVEKLRTGIASVKGQ